MDTAYLETPLGIAKLEGDQEGISSCILLEKSVLATTDCIPKSLENAVHQIHEYFEGSRTSFALKLNPKGTDFQKKVWLLLQEIPFGKSVSYMDIAKRLGNPKTIRAAATANGKNPLWILIPCHRVIGSDGSLTGYAGGLWRKKWLLAHESPAKQQVLF